MFSHWFSLSVPLVAFEWVSPGRFPVVFVSSGNSAHVNAGGMVLSFGSMSIPIQFSHLLSVARSSPLIGNARSLLACIAGGLTVKAVFH